MKAEWVANQYRGYSLRVDGTTYATIYHNQLKSFDIYLTGNLFNPLELPSRPTLTEAKVTAARAVFAHIVAVAEAIGATLGDPP